MRKTIIFTLIAAFTLAVFSPQSAAGARLHDALRGDKIDQRVQDRLAK